MGVIQIHYSEPENGTALAVILAVQPKNTLPVSLCDDDTNEDAFTLLHVKGIGIKICASS